MDHLRSGFQDQPDQYGETLSLKKILKKRTQERGQAQWLMPVIPALAEAKVGRSLELRSFRQLRQHSDTLSQQQQQKNLILKLARLGDTSLGLSYSGGWRQEDILNPGV